MSNTITAKELNKRSIELSKNATELGKQIHVHLLSLMNHVIAHRDTSVADVFMIAMSKTDKAGRKTAIVRSEAIKKWLQVFAFCSFGTDKDSGKLKSRLSKSAYNIQKEAGNFKDHIAKARINPWNKYTEEPAAVKVPFDIDAEIDRMIEALEKRIEQAMNGEGRFERQTEEAKAKNNFESSRLAHLVALKRKPEEVAA